MKRYKLRSATTTVDSEIDWDSVLNEQQRAVVMAGGGPLLVIAGAGTGKTHTLTHRVARLIETGVPADEILLLTFTNKAAKAMTDRVAALLSHSPDRLWSGTFHSIANRLLRQHAPALGYPDNYTIIDGEDASILMKTCVLEAGIDLRERRFPRGAVLYSILGYCINTGRKLADVLKERQPQFEELEEPIRDVFALYHTRKLELGVMDFDDLLLNWRRLLVELPGVSDALAGSFRHILVDEYQDTNALQGEIIDRMARGHRNVTVVGDDCQSIYRFRGAEYKNILQFPERYPDCQAFRLEINYRSTPEILDLTNRSIAHNEAQFPKTLRAVRDAGELPALVRARDVHQQADFVCDRILDLADEGVSLDEIAVLYRAHHHSMELQTALARRGIPHVIRSGVRFFEQAHIKDAIAYLKFVFNPRDELSFMRVAQHFRGVGTAHARTIWKHVREAGDPFDALGAPRTLAALPERGARSWTEAAEVLRQLATNRVLNGPAQLIEQVMSGPYHDYLAASFDNAENRVADLHQLANWAAQHDELGEFLGEVSLMTSISGQDILVGGQIPDEHVCLSSIHQAKGLEWAACFVLWLSDGHFPSASSISEEDGLQEERRLFYVASTRAKSELYLLHVLMHRGRDRRPVVLRESPFIEELRAADSEPWEEWEIHA